jgi:hypothetical protein
VTEAEERVWGAISRAWALSEDEERALLGTGTEADQRNRLALAVRAYEALHVLLPIPERADGWIRSPNTAFGGARALDVMTGTSDGLARVARYLLGQVV